MKRPFTVPRVVYRYPSIRIPSRPLFTTMPLNKNDETASGPQPPLSPKDFRVYNRMAEQMQQFVCKLGCTHTRLCRPDSF